MGCEGNKMRLDMGTNSEDSATINAEGPVEGGQIILPLTNFDTLNPLKTENKSYYHFSKLIFEGLFEFDKDLNVKEQLAESYEIRDEGRSIQIKLKDNILWHDGEKFKADDVAFTINTIKYSSADSIYGEMLVEALGAHGSTNIGKIIDISVLDDLNLIIKFDNSYSNNLEVLTFPIISRHTFEQGNRNNVNIASALAIDDYKVLGTGPFKFTGYEKKKQITLKSNENYRDGKPYIDEIIGRVIGTESDILTAFETGQINVATTIGVDWDKYSQNKRINILEYTSPNYEFLGFNFSKEIFSGEDGQGLRRAIAYGIDRQSIIETVYLGHGTQTDVPIHPSSWLLSDDANSYGYNLDEAKKELKKIGWEDLDGDGLLEDSNGGKISLNILTNSYNLMRLKTAEMIKEDLLKLGIVVNIQLDDEKEDITRDDIESQWAKTNESLSRGDYDIVLLGWQLSPISELTFALHSSNIYSNTNLIKYSNVEMDDVLEETFFMGTRDRKVDLYKNLQKLIVDDLPYVSLFFKNKALLVDSKIVGDLDPIFLNPYKGIEKCYIPEESQ